RRKRSRWGCERGREARFPRREGPRDRARAARTRANGLDRLHVWREQPLERLRRARALLLGRSALLRVGPPRRARDRPSSDGAQDAPRLARRERAADETRPPLAPPC